MATRSKSSKNFLERSGLRPTYRSPIPVHDTEQHPVHSLTLSTPLPNPEVIGVTLGNPPPDRGETTVWPHGTTEE